jgi:hypothetical protein
LQDIVEEFPMSLIREPTAFTSKDPKELYNNIFIFIVTEDAAGQNPSEMHIFQVLISCCPKHTLFLCFYFERYLRLFFIYLSFYCLLILDLLSR